MPFILMGNFHFLLGKKLPFYTILDYFRPFWMGTLSKMKGNLKILAKALSDICDALQQKVPSGHCYKLLIWYK